MRTTITIDDQLLEELKRAAAEQGTTVSRLIEDSVRLARQSTAVRKKQTFRLITFGRGGRFTHLDLDRMSTVIDEEDVQNEHRRR